MDKRWQQVGDLLVNHSVQVSPGDRVMIAMKEIETYPLVLGVYEACLRAGGYPQVQFLSEELNRRVMLYGSREHVDWVPEIEAHGMEWADVYLGLRGAHNLNVHWDIPSDVLAAHRRAMGTVSAQRWRKTRWCLLTVPNEALAHQAGVDLQTITDMWFNGCLLDWSRERHRLQAWADRLGQGSEVRVVGRNTDLTFSIAGRSWYAADGRNNMPDSEIATSPVAESVHGHISFDFPGVLAGRLMNDIFLRWDKGELVEATASTNQDFLASVVKTDAGASRIGEFAFGTNDAITHFCRDILIDEKMGGTVHIALGRAYPNTGGTNESAIHWDIIKDMRSEGGVYLDGELIYREGRMLI